jgi:protein-tyrosine kinase
MSRIHEALKRAALERRAGSVPAAPDSGTPGSAVPSTGTQIESALAARGIGAGLFEPVTLDGLRQKVPASAFKPYSETALFPEPGSYARPSGAEVFHTLRARLDHLREKRPLQTVLVTSALPGEGKTFVTFNLARAIAQQPRRSVLVINVNLRVARVMEERGALPAPGLSDFLKGEADLMSILQRGPEDNFFVISGGSSNTDPVELLATGRLRTLLNRLRPVFDWILLDSPPCAFLSDASLIAKVCDGVLIVVQSGLTPYDSAQKARREFPAEKLVGVVLNRVPGARAYGSRPKQPANRKVRRGEAAQPERQSHGR